MNSKLYGKKPQPKRSLADPQPPHVGLFISGGIGDFLALEPFFGKARGQTRTIYLATPRAEEIKQLLPYCGFGNSPKVKVVYDDFSQRDGVQSLSECIRLLTKAGKPVPPDLREAVDYSIIHAFPYVAKLAHLAMQASTLMSRELAGIEPLQLPSDYLVVAPYSNNKSDPARDFTEADWAETLRLLSRHARVGVVIGKGGDAVPEHPLLVNLYNRTSVAEAVEVVKGCRGYIGINSWPPTIAARKLHPDALCVKANNPWLDKWKTVYLAPMTQFPCLAPTIEEAARAWRP